MSFFNDYVPDPDDYEVVSEVDPDSPFAEWQITVAEAKAAVVL